MKRTIAKTRAWLLMIGFAVMAVSIGLAVQLYVHADIEQSEFSDPSHAGNVSPKSADDSKRTANASANDPEQRGDGAERFYPPERFDERIETFKQARRWDQATNERYVEKFGSNRGELIKEDLTFYFFNGEYVDEPFRVSRKGLAILVNDVQIDAMAWPSIYYVADNPPMPEGLTR
ncbi:MAG: hypothetical protein ACRD4B_05285, partial [Acidobacteriota bacterium]